MYIYKTKKQLQLVTPECTLFARVHDEQAFHKMPPLYVREREEMHHRARWPISPPLGGGRRARGPLAWMARLAGEGFFSRARAFAHFMVWGSYGK